MSVECHRAGHWWDDVNEWWLRETPQSGKHLFKVVRCARPERCGVVQVQRLHARSLAPLGKPYNIYPKGPNGENLYTLGRRVSRWELRAEQAANQREFREVSV